MRTPRVLSLLGAVALTLGAGAPALLAGDGLGGRARLQFGSIIGGQPLRIDLRTTCPSAPLLLFYGLDGTPTPLGAPQLQVLGLNLASSHAFFFNTDATGRFQAQVPTVPGAFGPADSGFAIFFQALVIAADGTKLTSNVKATEIQPLPALPGFLHEVAASHLPPGYDNLEASTVEHADLNHDGFPDLLLARADGVTIWMNDGSGGFTDTTATAIDFPGDPVAAIGTGDVDDDGDIDLVTGGGFGDTESVPDRLWLNDGSGLFTLSDQLPAGDGESKSLQFADIDRDGDLDLIVAVGQEGHLSVPGGSNRLLINTGNGHFKEDFDFAEAPWNLPDASTLKIRTGDVDNDGDIDLFVVRGTPAQQNVLLLNSGSGLFQDVSFTHILPLYTDNSQDAALADIDSDGDLDILVANSVLGTQPWLSGDVLINQGGLQGGTAGFFHDDPTSFLEAYSPADGIRLCIEAGDIDADGDIDVLLGVHDLFQGADQSLYLNQGGAQGGVTGSMVRQTWYDPGDFISYGVALFDMDHDGDLDVLQTAAGVISGDPAQQFQTRLFENQQL